MPQNKDRVEHMKYKVQYNFEEKERPFFNKLFNCDSFQLEAVSSKNDVLAKKSII